MPAFNIAMNRAKLLQADLCAYDCAEPGQWLLRVGV
jgi:hypothetical protein